jgi:hypothetical protein
MSPVECIKLWTSWRIKEFMNLVFWDRVWLCSSGWPWTLDPPECWYCRYVPRCLAFITLTSLSQVYTLVPPSDEMITSVCDAYLGTAVTYALCKPAFEIHPIMLQDWGNHRRKVKQHATGHSACRWLNWSPNQANLFLTYAMTPRWITHQMRGDFRF